MKNNDVPTRLLNNEHEIIADLECDGCGIEVYHGHTVGEKWYCSSCHLEQKEEVEKTNQPALCECGNKTNLIQTFAGKATRYVCSDCLEAFSADECPVCGELCKLQHTAGGFSGCRLCFDDRREGEQ